VLVTDVVKRDVPVYGEWVGTLAGFINAEIRAKVQGYLLKTTYQEGALVKEGDVLFELDPRQYQAAVEKAKADVAQTQAVLVRSQQNVDRYRPLVAKGAVSKKELDDWVQTAAANRANVDAARAALDNAKLELDWTTIRSPIAGIAGIAQAQVGNLIAPSTLMTTVSQVDPIKVYFPISEQEYLRFAARNPSGKNDGKDTEKRSLQLILADGTPYDQSGTVTAVNREVEVQTGSLQIQAAFPNPSNRLRPGGYAKVRALIDDRKNALVVPQRAVQEVQGKHQVVVIGKDDVAEIRPVTVGPKSGDFWVIDKGLEPTDRVVVEGLQKARNGTKVAPKPFASPSQ
jgi:membrane fusion protein (multidrug efflux system)